MTDLSQTGAAATPDPSSSKPTLSIANASQYEGTLSGSTTLTFTVTLSAVSTEDITVNYATSDVTATSSDYTAASGLLTIPAGSTQATFNVTVAHDLQNEANETFSVTLTGGANYESTGSTLQATGTILDDEKKNLIQISLGQTFACGISSNGLAYCWGRDDLGQVGDGAPFSNQDKPQAVITTSLNAGTRFTQVSAGGYHACGLASDGQAYCWGYGSSQAIGDGATLVNRDTPVAVDQSNLTSGTGFVQIRTSSYSSYGIASDGKAYCWGLNNLSQCGEAGASGASYIDKPYPIDTTNLDAGANFIQLEAGDSHACGLTSNGKVYCWGYPSYGQTGDNTVATKDKPVLVDTTNLTAGSRFVQIAAGGNHTCGLASDGKAYCWGLNTSGEVGNGNFTSQHNIPMAVNVSNLAAGTQFVKLALGTAHSCGIANDGVAYCWGADSGLGAYFPGDQNKPFAVDTSTLPSGSKFIELSAGYGSTLGITGQGLAVGWGYNDVGQLGIGADLTTQGGPAWMDLSLLQNVEGFVSLSARGKHACGVTGARRGFCWGSDANGELGNDASLISQKIPTLVDISPLTSGSRFSQITSGVSHTCALADDGKTYCWGNDQNDQLGDVNSGADQPTAVQSSYTNLVSGTSLKNIFAGYRFVLGLASDGKAYSWGIDDSGQLGDGGANANVATPNLFDISALTVGASFKSVIGGSYFSFGLSSDGKAYSWGKDDVGQLGDGGTNTDKNIPVLMDTSNLTAGSSFTMISAGEYHACGLASDGKAYCWGSDGQGQLGDDAGLVDKDIPVVVDTTALGAGKNFVKISCGGYFTCGISSDGKAYCWGADFNGALGDDTNYAHKSVPTAVDTSNLPTGSRIIDISAGSYFVCALTDEHRSFCWGADDLGQLGKNTLNVDSPIPVEIDTSGF